MRAGTKTFPGPRKGWIKNQSLVGGIVDGAEVLDNIFPTLQGGKLRRGSEKYATADAAVTRLFTWSGASAEKMFMATASRIFEITSPASPTVPPTADITGLTNGDWSTSQFSTSGGEYVVIANGADSVRHYDGTTWATPTITGVTSSTLNQVWAFKSRLFFIENGSLSFWYLPTNAIAGAATEFPLQGVFNLGGSILFGATWSLDSGAGIDDVCVFVSTKGEVAVYDGTDPSSGMTWALRGVYRIGTPLHKNGWFKAGGDLAILTEDGIIALSSALQRDRSAVQQNALTFSIEDEWLSVVDSRDATFVFSATLWQSKSMLMVGVPSVSSSQDIAFVANSRSGAWCRYTGWDVQTSAIFNDSLYFGSADYSVYKAEVTGNDAGTGYTAAWVPRFWEGDATRKFTKMARFRGRASETYNIGISAFADYEEGTYPSLASTTDEASNLWGTGIWGTMVWGAGGKKTYISEWSSVKLQGVAVAPAFSVVSNRVTAPTLEIIALDLVYEKGRSI